MKAAVVILAVALALAAPAALAQDAPEQQDELDARIEKLVKQLGADSYKEREAAMKELKKIGEPAVPALKEAATSKDAEVRWRAESILKELAKHESPSKDKRPSTADPRRGPTTRPRPPRGMDEVLKGLPEEQRKLIEEMLKKLDKIEKDFAPPRRVPPERAEEDEGEDFVPDSIRKMLEEMRKSEEEARKEFEKFRKRMEEHRRGTPQEGPKTEPRGGEEAKKQPPTSSRGGRTIILKRLRWKDGRLVEEDEYKYDSELPGLFVVDTGEVLRALRYHLELGENEGVLVDSVEKDSPFAAAGIQKHDIITKVNGKTVDSRNTLARLMKGLEKASVEVVRGGERKSLEVELGTEDKTPKGNK